MATFDISINLEDNRVNETSARCPRMPEEQQQKHPYQATSPSPSTITRASTTWFTISGAISATAVFTHSRVLSEAVRAPFNPKKAQRLILPGQPSRTFQTHTHSHRLPHSLLYLRTVNIPSLQRPQEQQMARYHPRNRNIRLRDSGALRRWHKCPRHCSSSHAWGRAHGAHRQRVAALPILWPNPSSRRFLLPRRRGNRDRDSD